jgi:hypothetical protein
MRPSPSAAILQPAPFRPLTPSQWNEIWRLLSPFPADLRDELERALAQIVYSYQTTRAMITHWPGQKLTRRRMQQIHKTARKLRQLLSAEFF